MAIILQWDEDMEDSRGRTTSDAEIQEWKEVLSTSEKEEMTTLDGIVHPMFYRLQMGNFVYLELKRSEQQPGKEVPTSIASYRLQPLSRKG